MGWVVLTLECTSGSELLTVVVEDNLTVVYSNSRNNTRFGRFQAVLVVFGQGEGRDIASKPLIIKLLSDGERIALMVAEVEQL